MARPGECCAGITGARRGCEQARPGRSAPRGRVGVPDLVDLLIENGAEVDARVHGWTLDGCSERTERSQSTDSLSDVSRALPSLRSA
jgi:hypothetical protein